MVLINPLLKNQNIMDQQMSYSPHGRMPEIRPVKVFDVENKKLIKTFDSLSECAAFLGVTSDAVHKAVKFKHKMRPATNSLGITLAFR